MTIEQLYDACTRTIGHSSDTPALDARIVIQDALGLDGGAFILHGRREVAPEDADRILEMAGRRASGTPVAYITGHRGFYMDDFIVNESTLIPRADTETLVEHAVRALVACIPNKTDSPVPSTEDRPSFNILDLCCGTGCIGISIAKAVSMECSGRMELQSPAIGLTLVDVSKPALDVCRANATKILGNGFPKGSPECGTGYHIGSRVGSHVEWRTLCGDLFEPVDDELFDLIATNPPYIQSHVVETLDEQVKREPILALDGGTDGLGIIRRIIDGAPRHLKPNGLMLMEIGYDQGKAVERLFRNAGFRDVVVEKDLGDRDRVVIGRI